MSEKVKKEPVAEKRFRLLKNPNQTSEAQTYEIHDGNVVVVDIDGYYFSLDKAMDKTIDFLKEKYGFVEVK